MKKTILLISLLSLTLSSLTFASNKKEIYTDAAPAPIGTYSQAIAVGSTVYISGQIPIDPKTGALVPGDFTASMEQAIHNLNAIAIAAGGNLDNIVKVTVYMPDLSNFATVNTVMEKYFHKPYPARAAIEIKSLPKNAPVEIEAVLVLDH